MNQQFFTVREQLGRLQEKTEKLSKERDELLEERKQFLEKIVNLETSHQDKDREIELKEIKIDSL